MIRKKPPEVIVMAHKDFPNVEIYACKRWCRVTQHVGDVDAWSGILDNQKFQIHCLKEPDCVISIMITYGTLSPDDC